MMSSVPPSTAPGFSGKSHRITAVLGHQGKNPVFELTFGGETISVLDGVSLNRWASIGIVERHKLAVSQEGISIDGHQIQYADPHATEELERLVNRPEAPSHPHPASEAPNTQRPVSDLDFAAMFADSLRVTRDGFEFHVVYRTRFGETKTARLEAALETLQNMRVFKPHVNLQKSGIRLVVTRWDGDNFVEEPGIANVEHASPEELEDLIRSHLLGGSPSGVESIAPTAGTHRARARVARLELIKKPHDAHFHFVFHRQDGKVEDGPVLIRANLAKLAAEGLFAPGVSISMTAMNDRITVTRKSPRTGAAAPTSESLPLRTVEDTKLVEALLNECLAPPESERATAAPHHVLPPPPKPVEPRPPHEPSAPAKVAAPAASLGELVAVPKHPEPADAMLPLSAPTVAAPKPAPPEAKPQSRLPHWMVQALEHSASIPFAEANTEIFKAVHTAWGRMVVVNERDFPAFTLEASTKDGAATTLEVVLAPHYLLCSFSFGYLRFGAEARVYLNRLDDYIAFPHEVLRGVQRREPNGLVFVVSREFCDFLQRQNDRSYRTQFLEFLTDVMTADPAHDLIWPESQEEKLFQLVSKSALSYGLPVTPDTVVLAPGAAEFIGFKKAAPHGMEFRDAADFVRFTPEAVEFSEDDDSRRFAVPNALLGWALDSQGRVCACYRKESGFVPPADPKLLRFLSEDQREQERSTLNFLAELP